MPADQSADFPDGIQSVEKEKREVSEKASRKTLAGTTGLAYGEPQRLRVLSIFNHIKLWEDHKGPPKLLSCMTDVLERA